MSNKTSALIAIALGLIAALLNWSYLSGAQASGLTVLRVKPDTYLQTGQLPPRDAFDSIRIFTNELEELKNVVVPEEEFALFATRPLTEPLSPGDILFLKSFNVQGDSGLRQELAGGERAIAITATDEAKAAGYFVRPGDVVDIWGTIADQAIILKKRARVLAVGDTYRLADDKQGDRQFRTITIVVPESDVAPLLSNVAAAGNEVTLSLVGPDDAKLQPEPATPTISTTALFNNREEPSQTSRPSRQMIMPAEPARTERP